MGHGKCVISLARKVQNKLIIEWNKGTWYEIGGRLFEDEHEDKGKGRLEKIVIKRCQKQSQEQMLIWWLPDYIPRKRMR